MLLLACRVSLAQVTIFPGDANNDGTANHFDVLPIGVAFGTEGIPRPGASPVWQGQLHPEPWPETLPVSGINYAFADTDGNGFIDEFDTDIIALNFDSTQNTAQPPPLPYLLPDTCFSCPKPDLVITFDRDTAMVRDTFFAFLSLEYPPNVPPPAGALGIAFDLLYDPENVKDDRIEVVPDTMPGDLLFVTATPTAAIAWRTAEGMIGFGAAGRGLNVLFAPRPLGRVSITVEDMVIRSMSVAAPFWLDVSNLLIINEAEQVICPGNIVTDTITLFDPINTVEEPADWTSAITVFPNPTSEVLSIHSTMAEISQIEVYNASGSLVQTEQMAPTRSTKFPLRQLSGGMYYLKIKTALGWTIEPFQVE
ncbi:MAG: T9SS type A sorting domain-containing protein [Bacteroidota bacterium]